MLEILTRQMQLLEIEISRQQTYLAKWEKHNDAHSDKEWEHYKENAEYNLRKWDYLKMQRDAIKASL